MFWRPVLSGTWGLLLLVPLAACSSADDAASDSLGSGPTSTEDRGSTGPTIAFLESDLQLVPGDTRTVSAVVDPPGVYEVHFSLSGDFDDAFLDQSQVDTSADGLASAMLTAPSSARTFTLRASVSGRSASLPVSVGMGFSDLEITPRYGGTRTITTWIATVRTGSSCRALPGIPASDGPLIGEAIAGQAPVVAGVPVGVPLTVTLRAGHFAGGCAELPGAVAGTAHNSIDVKVIDRPLQMSGVSLSVELDIDPTTEMKNAWDRVATSLAANFVNNAASDATALLDSMLDRIPASTSTDRDAFRTARSTLGWDKLLESSLHQRLGADGLRGVVSSLIRDAFPRLTAEGIKGTLTSRLGFGFASFEVSSFGGLGPVDVGTSLLGGPFSAIGITWMDAPGDQVLFGGEPKWPLSRLAAAMALEPALVRDSDPTMVPDVLASKVSCTDVATTLASGASTATAYADCATACVQKLCEGALNLMWTRAAYTPDDPTLVDFAATATATVSDDAKPATFRGSWAGSLRVGTTTDKMGGAATGK
jgi:hypothetical protein